MENVASDHSHPIKSDEVGVSGNSDVFLAQEELDCEEHLLPFLEWALADCGVGEDCH
jgi:hypothetical protein